MDEDEIKMTTEYDEYYDKKDIAIMIRDSTLDCELSCSLIEDQIVNDCCGCSLKFICDKKDWYYGRSDGFWYYLNERCKMVRGSKDKPLRVWLDSACYCFNEHGRMYCDCVTPDGWRVDESGVWVR